MTSSEMVLLAEEVAEEPDKVAHLIMSMSVTSASADEQLESRNVSDFQIVD